MKLRRVHLIYFSLLLLSWNSGISQYPEDYFEFPLSRAIFLSGTFGELRPGHFHSGIDIKSVNGEVGEAVSASASGYVARVKVSPGGYGNAIYIAHPNGYTSVYAHLDRFADEIAAYVKEKQYELKQFGVDLYPKPNQFKFEQNQLLGYLGNSGSSFGPHLHFEIRRSSDQVPINPFLFGLQITDNVEPELSTLQVYYLSEKFEQLHTLEYPLQRTGPGIYMISDTLSEGAWRTGFAVKTTDKMNGVPNRNGIYELQMYVDGDRCFGFAMNEVPFSKTRYLNAHIDYAARQNKKGYFHRCFKLPGNALDIYSIEKNNGIVELYANQPQKINIAVRDINDNLSTLTFFIKRDSVMHILQSQAAEYNSNNNETLSITKSNFNCVIPKGTFYNQTGITYRLDESRQGTYAETHNIGSEEIPLHRFITISIKPEGLESSLLQKAFIARHEEDEIMSYGGELNSGYITAPVREFGAFTIGLDTTPPVIKPIQFSSNMQGASRMRFKITDDVPTGGKARGLRYDAHVDGKWVLMEYDAKNDMLTHWFDSRIAPGNHELILKVQDDRGNQTVLKQAFKK